MHPRYRTGATPPAVAGTPRMVRLEAGGVVVAFTLAAAVELVLKADSRWGWLGARCVASKSTAACVDANGGGTVAGGGLTAVGVAVGAAGIVGAGIVGGGIAGGGIAAGAPASPPAGGAALGEPATQNGQYHSPSGTASSGGSRQRVWYALPQSFSQMRIQLPWMNSPL